jgi:hypothetical protein
MYSLLKTGFVFEVDDDAIAYFCPDNGTENAQMFFWRSRLADNFHHKKFSKILGLVATLSRPIY